MSWWPRRDGRTRAAKDLRPQVERELEFHIEMRARDLAERGLSESDARLEAQRRFGDYQEMWRECLEIDERRRDRMNRTQFWSELRQDVGYALRMYRRSPGFAAVALLTLALGIGATSAIFSVVNGVLLQPLPFTDPQELYRVNTLYPDGTQYSLSAPDFASLRQDTRVFDRIEAAALQPRTLRGMGEPREVRTFAVSDGLFSMLGFERANGRLFDRPDHEPGRGDAAVLDHGFWLREFGGDSSAIGRSIQLGTRTHTIVGVLEAGARLPAAADLYTPIEYTDIFKPTDQPARRGEFLLVVARAKDGVAAGQVTADLQRVGTDLQNAFPNTNARLTFTGTPYQDTIVGDVRTPLWVLLGSVVFVLLVACVNVANLLLARASARQEEIAVRAALGAGRRRLIRQLVTESVLLFVLGAAAGLGLAYAGTKALVAARPADIPRLDQISVDTTVVLVTLMAALVTGLLFGLLPAFQATGRTLSNRIREGGRSGAPGRASHRLRAGLVVAEMALAVMLLMGAGLLIRSFVQLTQAPRGFESAHGTMFTVTLEGPQYQTADPIRARVVQLEARLKQIPGVTAAAAATVVPLGAQGAVVDFAVVGAPPPPANVNAEIGLGSITPEYFRAIGTPVVSGREFTDRDITGAPLVAMISQAGVRQWFGGESPIGKMVTAAGAQRQIVGVVGDIRARGLRDLAGPMLYVPYMQRTARSPRFIVRTSAESVAPATTIRSAFREIDPEIPISAFVPFSQLVADSVARPRFYTSLLVLFAATALVLAAVGIFGVMSYSVAQRSREIGIRLALGAARGQVMTRIVGRALGLAALGAALGVVGTLGLARVIQSLLFGVPVLDPITLAAVVIVLCGSATLASYLPARRAASIDPVIALREG